MTMIALGKHVMIAFCFLTCCLFGAQADKWRAIAKKLQRCEGPERAIELRNVNLTYSHKGDLFNIAVLADVQQEITLGMAKVTLFRMGGKRPLKFLYFEYKDLCKSIMTEHEYINPIFASGEVPRQCHYDKAKYVIKNISFDLHGVMIGANIRGDYLLQVDAYVDGVSMFCEYVDLTVKKDTLH